MQYSSILLVAAFAIPNVFAHGVITEIQGANGVNMPALSVIDGTPRDCATPACGAEADTSIIRKNELGTSKASALGRTNGGGPVSAANMMAIFMDGSAGNSSEAIAARAIHLAKRGFLDSLTGGLGGLGGAGGAGGAGGGAGGVKTPSGTKETGVKAATGAGLANGLPTTSNDGTITMVFHQVNQDGAGPLTGDVDPTSGGTDPAAFKTAAVTQNVPGLGFGGLSAVQTTEFPVKMQMPAGMTCSGSVGGVENVCIARVQNSALAGPFGGSVAFTQSPAAKKRAIEYNLRKRRFARLLVKKEE